MEKKIKLNANRIIMVDTDEFYPTHNIEVREYLQTKNGDLKVYGMQKKEDYYFNAFVPDEEQKFFTSFEFDINHPLYFPLLHLLNGDERLIIDDDDTRKIKEKYLEIYLNKNKIVMSFINNKEEIELDRFSVFVKNVAYDTGSKIDDEGLDTKIRLNNFFREASDILMNDNHQITIEEYIAKQRILKK